MDAEILTLASGAVAQDLVPPIGGSVAALRYRGVDVFRALSVCDRQARNVLGVGMFPMVPYANRIGGNAFTFRGQRYEVAANNPPERFNVHGTGWHRAWGVSELSGARAVLTLEETGAPYAYRAEQVFEVDDNGVTAILRISNAGPVAMPFGLGLHPWFPRDDDVRLVFRAARFHPEGPDMVAQPAESLPVGLDFAVARPLPVTFLNNDFGGWAGRAVLEFTGRGVVLTMTADASFGHLMVYADPGKPFFCVEPQTNAASAFSRGRFDDPDEGVIVLAPDETAGGRIRFDLEALAG